MAIKIEEFIKTASDEQRYVLDRVIELSEKEDEACSNYSKIQRKVDETVSGIKTRWGLQIMMVQADLELLVDPMLPERNRYANQFEQVRAEMKELFQKAVCQLEMGHLGFIQRHYEKVVGEKMPEA